MGKDAGGVRIIKIKRHGDHYKGAGSPVPPQSSESRPSTPNFFNIFGQNPAFRAFALRKCAARRCREH